MTLPGAIAIEVTNRCNASCAFCPIHQPPFAATRAPVDMSLPLFERILHQLLPTRPLIRLHLGGEPLLDQTFTEKLQLIKRFNLQSNTEFFTNGQFLTDSIIDAIVASDIFGVVIAFDGATPQTYEKHRRGCNYHKVLLNLKNLASKRKSTYIGIQYVKTLSNQHETNDTYLLMKSLLRRNDFFYESVSVDWGVPELGKDIGILQRYCDNVPATRCGHLYSSICVMSDGRVPACCWDYALRLGAMGDANQELLADIWHGRAFSLLRGDTERRCQGCLHLRMPLLPQWASDVRAAPSSITSNQYIFRF